ncbi:MAG: hypothetical protein WDA06_00115 [Phenylobacterium sp.]
MKVEININKHALCEEDGVAVDDGHIELVKDEWQKFLIKNTQTVTLNEDIIVIIKDAIEKIISANNLLKDGKVLFTHNKLLGLQQKLSFYMTKLSNENN